MSTVKYKIKSALHDQQLYAAIQNASNLSTAKRDDQILGLDDYESSRDAAREVRQRSVDYSPRLIEKFTQEFTALGGKVYIAANASEANRITINILKSHGAEKGVKSKSMVTEEIFLGRALESAGIDAVETDLGEYIVQLAGEKPSHITAPAMHKSRQSIGRLFAEKLGIKYTDDPAELTEVARGMLRERFLNAEFGISGANFLIAETGHIAIVENEGNVRLGLSIPPVYIAVTGIEKLLEKLADLSPLVKMLAKSATGQKFSGYFHLLKPSREGEDGPEEMHVILIDNGRSRAMADPEMREMMLCIRCGACLNECPVYRTIGGHAYDSTYPGPMGSVLSNLLGRNKMLHQELPDLSTLCGACKDVCPVRIDLPKLLLELRARREKPLSHNMLASGWKWTMESSSRVEVAGKFARMVEKVVPKVMSGGVKPGGPGSFRTQVEKRKSQVESPKSKIRTDDEQ
ncbi:MAG: lactate utilization protein [Calditrichaeota bacterium]|nr:lactate utilization protein [Calditrichota bacterium]